MPADRPAIFASGVLANPAGSRQPGDGWIMEITLAKDRTDISLVDDAKINLGLLQFFALHRAGEKPVSASAIMESLEERGWRLGAASIIRTLRDLERKGYLESKECPSDTLRQTIELRGEAGARLNWRRRCFASSAEHGRGYGWFYELLA